MTSRFEKMLKEAEACLFFWDVEDLEEWLLWTLIHINKNRGPVFGKGFVTEDCLCVVTGYPSEFVFEALRFMEAYDCIIRTNDDGREIISTVEGNYSEFLYENNVFSIRKHRRLKRLRAWRGF